MNSHQLHSSQLAPSSSIKAASYSSAAAPLRLKGHWTLPGGVLELGESLHQGVVTRGKEETGLTVEPLELIELLDRIHREESRIQFHYVIADYLCRVIGGEAKAASDADEIRWVERSRMEQSQRS